MPLPTKNQPTKPRPSFFKAYWAAGLWGVIILVLTGLPGEDLPDINFWDLNFEDKIAHFGVFAVLAALMVYGTWKRGPRSGGRLRLGVAIVAIAGLYGAVTEALQGAVFVSRYPSFGDFIADLLGAALGTVFAFYFLSKHRKD